MGGGALHVAGRPALPDLSPAAVHHHGRAVLYGHFGHPGAAWSWIGWDNYREFFVLQNARDLRNALGAHGHLRADGHLGAKCRRPGDGRAAEQALPARTKPVPRGVFHAGDLGVTVVATIWKLLFSTPTGRVFLFMRDVLGSQNPPAILSSFEYASRP